MGNIFKRTIYPDRTHRTQKGLSPTEQAWVDWHYNVIRFESGKKLIARGYDPAKDSETVKIRVRYKRVGWDANRLVEIWRCDPKEPNKWNLYAMAVTDHDSGRHKFEQLKPLEKYTGPIYPE